MKSKKKTIKFVLGCVISVVFLYLAFRNVEFSKLIAVFKKINYFWVFPFVAITLLSMFLRAFRWRWIMKPKYDFPSRRLFPSLLIGFALNSLLPFRAGEFARPYVLAKKEGLSYASVFATVFVERIIDMITLLLCLTVVFLFVEIDPAIEFTRGEYTVTGEKIINLKTKVVIMAFALLIGATTMLFESTRAFYAFIIKRLPLIGKGLKTKLLTLLERFSAGFQSLKSPRALAVIMIYSLIIWGLVGFSLQVMSWGFPQLELDFFDGMAVMIIICIAIMIPSVPGYWGLYEAGCVAALLILGVVQYGRGEELALSFSLMIHAFQIIPVIIVGIYYLWRENLSIGQLEEKSKQKEEDIIESEA